MLSCARARHHFFGQSNAECSVIEKQNETKQEKNVFVFAFVNILLINSIIHMSAHTHTHMHARI